MTTTLYKLTDQQRYTGHNHIKTRWRVGFRPPRLSGDGELCSGSWYHAYDHPLLAVFHNPIHAGFTSPRCCTVEVAGDDVGRLDGPLKVGFRTGRVTGWVDLPEVTPVQRVAYGIYCALIVYDDSDYVGWAEQWLSGEDRSWKAARAAGAHAADGAYANAADPAYTAAYAAAAAARAARAAARAAHAAANAAYAAHAARAAADIDLLACAERAMKIEQETDQ
jgi:hypothetical protein